MRSVSELVLSVQDRCSLPLQDGDRFDRAAVIRIMNEVLEEEVTPKIVVSCPEILTQRIVLPLKTNGVANYPNKRIPIPSRAYGRGIREVKYLNDSETKRENEVNITQTSLQEFDTMATGISNYGNASNRLYCYFEGDSVVISLDPDDSGSIVIYYTAKPNTLVDGTSFLSMKIQDYNTTLGWFNVVQDTISGFSPPAMPSLLNAQVYDIFRKTTGSILVPQTVLTMSAVSPNYLLTYTFSADEAKNLMAFQTTGAVSSTSPAELYITPAGTTYYSTLPPEFDHILVLETCIRIMESLGDEQMLQVLANQLQKAYTSIAKLTSNRLPGQRKRVTDNRSLAKQQRFRNYGRGFLYR
jgi:hypothetical protein